MNFAALESLLQETIGLDATTIGSASVERAIRERMRAVDLNSCEDYAKALADLPTELQELVEAVVVPETWFFRDAGAFAALEKMVRETWLPKNPTATLRILSLPCSSGEEPYSIAITLQKAGMTNFQIDAMDVSHRVLATAREGIFGRNSFRGATGQFREQYFAKHAKGHALHDEFKRHVSFQQGNLLDPGFGAGRGKYDFIFCRNLLIYFDGPTRERVFRVLAEMLADDGVLFVGPSESGVAVNHGFVSTKISLAFAFWKSSNPLAAPVEKPAVKLRPPGSHTTTFRKLEDEKPKPAPVVETDKEDISLERAHQFADAGKLAEATRLCQAHLTEHGPSAQVYYLLGLVQDASNQRDEARNFYRKALYLQPNHYEALAHLALLTQSMGDSAGARVLQDRAERANQNIKS